MGEHREWLRTWVKELTRNQPLTPQAEERALNVAEEAFHDHTGVGQAAQRGVEAVEREIYRKPPRQLMVRWHQ